MAIKSAVKCRSIWTNKHYIFLTASHSAGEQWGAFTDEARGSRSTSNTQVSVFSLCVRPSYVVALTCRVADWPGHESKVSWFHLPPAWLALWIKCHDSGSQAPGQRHCNHSKLQSQEKTPITRFSVTPRRPHSRRWRSSITQPITLFTELDLGRY